MSDGSPVLLLTRPRAGSEAFLAALRAIVPVPHVVVSPVIRIVPSGLKPDFSGQAGVILTSANAARSIEAANGLPAYCVGQRTTEVASAQGFQARFCGENADALVASLLDLRPPAPLVHLRGDHARGDIAARLTEGGVPTSEAVLYRQEACALTDEARALLDGEGPVILPLFSPRSADIVAGQLRPKAPVDVVAISRAVADHAGALTPRRIIIAATPDQMAVCQEVASLYRKGTPLEGG